MTTITTAVGLGMYLSASDEYQISENDVAVGLMGRSHTVVGQVQGVSQAQDAPANRSDLGAFGPSWEADLLGGQLSRKLTPGSGAITTTDLVSNQSTRYNLTDSVAGPTAAASTPTPPLTVPRWSRRSSGTIWPAC